jgi:hypothetical protein
MPKSLLCAIVAVAVLGPAIAAATDTANGRVFLLDGTTLGCAGEYARVDDRVVFSMPIGAEPDGQPRLQLVTLPSSKIDWPRTERYRDAVRAARYVATRGEGDFTALTAEVARTLSDISLTDSTAQKLALAEDARRRLIAWPAQHYGYRGNEVRDIVALLDEAVSDLRAATGAQSFDLDLVAMSVPEPEALAGPPSPHDVVAQSLAAADAADVVEERVGVLDALARYLDSRESAGLTGTARLAARTFVARRLDEEHRADRDYDRLARELTRQSARRLARNDVRGIERLSASIDARDASLGRRRPDRIRALAAAIADDLASARRLRLARDQWHMRVAAYRSYSRLIKTTLTSLDLMQGGLDDIKRLAGPDAARLSRLGTLAERGVRQLRLVVPPSDLATVHSLLQSACEMGRNAASIRFQAVSSGDMATAWNASAAAAGSLMLVAQARDELGRYLKPPTAK